MKTTGKTQHDSEPLLRYIRTFHISVQHKLLKTVYFIISYWPTSMIGYTYCIFDSLLHFTGGLDLDLKTCDSMLVNSNLRDTLRHNHKMAKLYKQSAIFSVYIFCHFQLSVQRVFPGSCPVKSRLVMYW